MEQVCCNSYFFFFFFQVKSSHTWIVSLNKQYNLTIFEIPSLDHPIQIVKDFIIFDSVE